MSAIQWSETFFRLCQNRATRKRSISPSANEGRCALRIAAQPYSITKRKPPAAAGETGGRVEHMQKYNTRGIPSAQPLSADSSSLPSIPPKDGALGPANEQYPRQQLKLFEHRCQTLAHRVSCNQLNFIEPSTWPTTRRLERTGRRCRGRCGPGDHGPCLHEGVSAMTISTWLTRCILDRGEPLPMRMR